MKIRVQTNRYAKICAVTSLISDIKTATFIYTYNSYVLYTSIMQYRKLSENNGEGSYFKITRVLL